jgi:hypothetical protein
MGDRHIKRSSDRALVALQSAGGSAAKTALQTQARASKLTSRGKGLIDRRITSGRRVELGAASLWAQLDTERAAHFHL